MITKNTFFERNKQTMTKRVKGKFVVFDIETGKIYRLNLTGWEIWGLFKKPTTIKKAATKLVSKYHVTQARAENDIAKLIYNYKFKLFQPSNTRT